MDATIDRIGCNPNSAWAYNWPHTLATFTKDLDLVDIWRQRHPNEAARLVQDWICIGFRPL